MKSEFTYWVFFVFGAALILNLVLLVFLLNMFEGYDRSWIKLLLIGPGLVFVNGILVVVELRTKAIEVEFDEEGIIKKNFAGLGRPVRFDWDEIDGFKLDKIYSKSAGYECLYLMRGDERIVKLSEYYHQNYKELKRYVQLIGIVFKG